MSKDAKTEKYFGLIKENYKRGKYILNGELTGVKYDGYLNDRVNNFLQGDFLFFSRDYFSNPMALYDFLTAFESKALDENSSDKLLIYPDTLSPEGNIKGYTSGNISINANSRLKNEAFDFVKFMLSEQIQSSEYFLSGLAPVNKISYNKMKQEMLETAAADGKTGLAEKIINMIEGANEFSDTRNPPITYLTMMIFANTSTAKYRLAKWRTRSTEKFANGMQKINSVPSFNPKILPEQLKIPVRAGIHEIVGYTFIMCEPLIIIPPPDSPETQKPDVNSFHGHLCTHLMHRAQLPSKRSLPSLTLIFRVGHSRTHFMHIVHFFLSYE